MGLAWSMNFFYATLINTWSYKKIDLEMDGFYGLLLFLHSSLSLLTNSLGSLLLKHAKDLEACYRQNLSFWPSR